MFWPVGNAGWYPHGEDKAPFDQQPIEAATMSDAALAAFGVCNEERYLLAFRRARGWFHGQNSLRQPLIEIRRGACYDGLHPCGANRNQGAESTLAYLWTEVLNFEIENALRDNAKASVASA